MYSHSSIFIQKTHNISLNSVHGDTSDHSTHIYFRGIFQEKKHKEKSSCQMSKHLHYYDLMENFQTDFQISLNAPKYPGGAIKKTPVKSFCGIYKVSV